MTNQLFLNLVQHYVADQSITTVRKYVADEQLTQRLSLSSLHCSRLSRGPGLDLSMHMPCQSHELRAAPVRSSGQSSGSEERTTHAGDIWSAPSPRPTNPVAVSSANMHGTAALARQPPSLSSNQIKRQRLPRPGSVPWHGATRPCSCSCSRSRFTNHGACVV